MYNMLKYDFESNPDKKNWCSLLYDLLCTLGFNDAWLFQDIGDSVLFLSLVKQRLKDQFIQNWNGRLEESSRAIFYKHISSFDFKPYLNILNISKFRYSMTKLRVSSHRLSIESGRWSKPNPTPLSERNCLFCNLLEDEYHFVLECNLEKESCI